MESPITPTEAASGRFCRRLEKVPEGILKESAKKSKKCLTEYEKTCIIIFAVVIAAAKNNDGLSPNGKATDSDSVIVKVRILLAQFERVFDF